MWIVQVVTIIIMKTMMMIIIIIIMIHNIYTYVFEKNVHQGV